MYAFRLHTRRSSHRMVLWRRLAFLQRELDDLVDDDAVLRVHAN